MKRFLAVVAAALALASCAMDVPEEPEVPAQNEVLNSTEDDIFVHYWHIDSTRGTWYTHVTHVRAGDALYLPLDDGYISVSVPPDTRMSDGIRTNAGRPVSVEVRPDGFWIEEF